jgi:hypothetical protein
VLLVNIGYDNKCRLKAAVFELFHSLRVLILIVFRVFSFISTGARYIALSRPVLPVEQGLSGTASVPMLVLGWLLSPTE